eukprot:454687-Pyramimonas_sp.AAC.1
MGNKRAHRRALRLVALTGACWYKGQHWTRSSIAALATSGVCHEPHVDPSPSAPSGLGMLRKKRSKQLLKIWSYNTESLVIMDRLGEILRLARDREVAVCCFQSALMSLNIAWHCEGFRILPTPRTSPKAKDGCLIAVNKRFFGMDEIRCVHEWVPGRLQGVRLRRAGRRPRDLYVLNGYSWTNEPPRAPQGQTTEVNEKHWKSQDAFWQQCEDTISRIPGRSALVWCLDANASVAPSPPNTGFAGSRRSLSRTNQNGHKFLSVLQNQGLAALNTFGKASRFNSTWVHTDGVSWSTIDYVCVRLQGGYGRASRPLIDLPVSLGGYRDHRPVEATIYAGL